jgi:indoleacetamide hydrolase
MEGIDREVGRIVDAALDTLKHAGAEIVPIDLPTSLRAASDVELPLLGYELFPGFSRFLAEEGTGVSLEQLLSQVGDNLKPLVEGSRHPVGDDAFRELDRKQKQMKAEAIAFFRANRIDALAFAPSLTPAFKQGDPNTLDINGKAVPPFTAIGRQVAIGACASLACLVLPAGMTPAGLPVGLEFDAVPGADRRLLAMGLSLEKVLPPLAPPAL